MAAECITPQKNDVDKENETTDIDVKAIGPSGEAVPRVLRKQDDKDHGEIHKVAVNVLDDQGERALAPVSLAGFTDRAVGRIRPECFVISAPIVVTGDAETARRPED